MRDINRPVFFPDYSVDLFLGLQTARTKSNTAINFYRKGYKSNLFQLTTFHLFVSDSLLLHNSAIASIGDYLGFFFKSNMHIGLIILKWFETRP